MSDYRPTIPCGANNLPPGVTLADIEGARECPHQGDDGGDAFACVSYSDAEDDDGSSRALFRCQLCGEEQERRIYE